MATSLTLHKLLALVHQYVNESAPVDSDAAAERDLAYFDGILALLGQHDASHTDERALARPAEFRVRWEIDLSASGHVDAARQARNIQLRHDSIATIFQVVRRTDADQAPEWSLAESIDLSAHRSDQEVLDEIARVIRDDAPLTDQDLRYLTELLQLTGRVIDFT